MTDKFFSANNVKLLQNANCFINGITLLIRQKNKLSVNWKMAIPMMKKLNERKNILNELIYRNF